MRIKRNSAILFIGWSFVLSGCATSMSNPTFVTEDMRIQSKVYTSDVDSTFNGVEQAISQLKWAMIESNRGALYMLIKPP